MRVGVVDIGTNSTRLLICDVAPDGSVTELDRRSEVTRLGEGVDVSGSLQEAPVERVFRTLETYRDALDAAGVQRTSAVMTSAVRDASNGWRFGEEVRRRFGLAARILSGDEEAGLTFHGAMSERRQPGAGAGVVIDIGGGSTELIVGQGGEMTFHASLQIGVVRLGEPWQFVVLAAAAALLLVLGRGVVATLLLAGAAGTIVALAGAPLAH